MEAADPLVGPMSVVGWLLAAFGMYQHTRSPQNAGLPFLFGVLLHNHPSGFWLCRLPVLRVLKGESQGEDASWVEPT